MQEENRTTLKRTMGLPSAIAMLVGCVVGASVFIVPGQLAGEIGPGVWIAYLIGGLAVLFAALMFAQVGSVMPVSAANYRLSVATVNGAWGFLYIWVYAISSVFLMPIMSLTTAQYLGVFHPALNSLPVAVCIVIVTGGLNMFGLNTSNRIQNVLVIGFVTVIAVFITGGLSNADWSHFTPMFPSGFMPVVVGAVATYYAFAGFNNVIELSGEIKNPGRNVIRMVIIGFVVIMVLYIGVAVAAVALAEPSTLGVVAPISFAAGSVFPSWFSGLIAFAAVAASWTTLNAVMAALSRQVFALSRSRILPRSWSQINRAGAPYVAIAVVTALGVLMTLFSEDVMRFINLSSTYLLLTAIVVAVSSLRLKSRLAERYAAAEFKLRGFWYYFWPIGVIASSTYFLVLAISVDPFMSMLSGLMVPVGLGLYLWRSTVLRRQGIHVEEIVAQAISEEADGTAAIAPNSTNNTTANDAQSEIGR